MKKYLFLLIISFIFLIGCGKSITYSIESISYIPEEKEQQYVQAVADIVKSATNKLTTEDYEDVDDTIAEARRVVNSVYARSKYVLQVVYWEEGNMKSVMYYDKNELQGHKLEIYNKILETGISVVEEIE